MTLFCTHIFSYIITQGGRQNSAFVSNATRYGAASTSGAPAPRGPPVNGKVKQEVHMSSAKTGDKFTSNGQQPVNNFANTSDQTSLKVRLKVGSDNLSTRKKAEIYSGLGLDVSPSSSLEASPVDSDDFCHVPRDTPCHESPTSILEVGIVPNIYFLSVFLRGDKIGLPAVSLNRSNMFGQVDQPTSFVHFCYVHK